ncbi:nucleoside hydrolase-like domain-containing protein [Paenibacillus sp. YN15]|uniref:nucleoside hydrolase-like domain-containing protein n=1 Tax=Paenibacillus sp. YN15 TaxID=1742774 RepID=UPI000DCB575A|nr:nucleoside hydrolase-like domain-containing protein [Paenibacillus sp. YN15]RAU98606.1 hypothetical protein DQG13_17070 [Paenibacillus sp. YN15]
MTNAQIRLIVLTDISSLQTGFKEPDDTQSLVRLLLYANEFEIESLIATCTNHWSGEVKPDYIRAIVKEYGKVCTQLQAHDPRYPSEEYLLSVIKSGNSDDGPEFIGDGHDTEGSEWILQAMENEDERPLWVIIWGGTMELAQALWKAEHTRSRQEFLRLIARLRIFSIVDQNRLGSWVRDHYPELFYIRSFSTTRGIYKGGDTSLVTDEWLLQHVTEGHGPLGAAYPKYDGGDIFGKGVKGIKEGDTPSFLYLIPNGLSNPERPDWGGWGGRYELGKGALRHYFDSKEFQGTGEHEDSIYWSSVYRWRDAFQRSFQARMDWCVLPPDQANHEPVVVIQGDRELEAISGNTILLDASSSYDPDGDDLTYEWFIYREAGSFKGDIAFQGEKTSKFTFVAPKVEAPETIHIVLAATDTGNPPLTSYGRVIVTIHPQ